jgi:hypothetical protein
VGGFGVEAGAQMARQAQHERHLHPELECAADHRSPGEQHRQTGQLRTAEREEGRDHGRVPRERRGIGEEEFAVAVQNSQAPRGGHEQSDAGKENLHQANSESAGLAFEAGSDGIDEPGGGKHADQHEHGGGERKDTAHGARHAVGLFAIALGQQAGVDRDEGGGERTLAEHVLQKVRDADGGVERVRGKSQPEVVEENALAGQADDAGEQNAGGYQEGVAARPLHLAQLLQDGVGDLLGTAFAAEIGRANFAVGEHRGHGGFDRAGRFGHA